MTARGYDPPLTHPCLFGCNHPSHGMKDHSAASLLVYELRQWCDETAADAADDRSASRTREDHAVNNVLKECSDQVREILDTWKGKQS